MSFKVKLLLLSAVVTTALFSGTVYAYPAGASSPAGLSAPAATQSGGYQAANLRSTFGQRTGTARALDRTDSRVLKVISLLGKKTDDPKVIDRLRHKLSTLGEKRLRMVSSLSDRVLKSEHEVEAEVAFMLVTALIVFS